MRLRYEIHDGDSGELIPPRHRDLYRLAMHAAKLERASIRTDTDFCLRITGLHGRRLDDYERRVLEQAGAMARVR